MAMRVSQRLNKRIPRSRRSSLINRSTRTMRSALNLATPPADPSAESEDVKESQMGRSKANVADETKSKTNQPTR